MDLYEICSKLDLSPEQCDSVSGMYDILGIIAYVALIVATVAAIAFGVIQMIRNPKGALKGIIGLVAIAALFIIGYATSSAEMDDIKFEVSELTEKLVGAGIITTYVLLIVGVLSLIYSEISTMIVGKK